MAMSKAMAQSKVNKKGQAEPTSRLAKPKQLSKAGEWRLAYPNGYEGTYDMRAVMR